MTQDLLQEPEDQTPALDPNKDYLTDLIGDDKKYKTVEEAAQALAKKGAHADATIDIMKRRLDLLSDDYKKAREENITKAKLEEMIDQIATQKFSNSAQTQANDTNQPPQFDPKQLDVLISNKIKENAIERQQQDNSAAVRSKLIERYGENYQTVVKQQIETLGLSSEDFNVLAKKSPSALYRTLGLDQQPQESYQAPFRSSQRNDNFAPTSAAKRSWAYYQELKKKDPQMYYDRKTAIQMAKDAVELGEGFRDGDYYVKGLHEE